jgi:hypothetical protein
MLAELLVSHLDPLPEEYNLFLKEEASCMDPVIDEHIPNSYHGEGTEISPFNLDSSENESSTNESRVTEDIPHSASSQATPTVSLDEAMDDALAEEASSPQDSEAGQRSLEESSTGDEMFVADANQSSNIEIGPQRQGIMRSPIQRTNPSRKRRRTKHITSGDSASSRALTYAYAFASEESIRSTLREAVFAKRCSSQHPCTNQHKLARLWASLNSDDQHRVLKLRRDRYQFSQLFWEEVQKLGGHRNDRMSKHVRAQMKVKLGIDVTDKKNWKSALQQAQRSSIWTEMAEIFKGDLKDDSEVVICGISEATSTLEVMTTRDRNEFLKKIRSRVSEPNSKIIPRLKVASPLYWVVMDHDLPPYPLCIECQHVEYIAFEDVVSLKQAPVVLPLHRQGL